MKAGEAVVEEEEVEFKVLGADLDGVMAADEAEVAAEFDEEILEFFNQAAMEIGFGMILGQVEKLNQITVFKDGRGVGMQFSQRC